MTKRCRRSARSYGTTTSPAAPKDDLFAAFQKAQQGTAEDMIAAFRARRAPIAA